MSLRYRIEQGEYTNHNVSPKKEHRCKCGKCFVNIKSCDLPSFCPDCGTKQDWKLHHETYKKQCEEYANETKRLLDLMKEDIFKEFNVSDNPKRGMCYKLAWRYSDCHIEVYERFEEFVALIK